MRIGVMTTQLGPNDAVGGDAYGMVETLLGAGYDAVLFTATGTSQSPWQTYNYADALWKLSEHDFLIYHFCTADEVALKTLRQLKCRMSIKYHNVTPSHFMAPYSDVFTYATRLGRMMLDPIADLPLDWIIGDSEYNIQEFRSLVGDQPNMVVIPVFNHAEELLFAPAEPATVQYVSRHPTNILSVGRLVPNKGHVDTLEAFAQYLQRGAGRPHLHLVGSHDPRLSSYTSELQGIIAHHGMSDAVSLHPTVGQQALASYYRGCDLFWTGSRHEGFCVPAVEAMAFGLPILSTTAGALPKTCGDAALYADGPTKMADALGKLLGDDKMLVDLRRRGRRRYETYFHRRHVSSQFLAFIDRWITSPDTPAGAAPRPADVGDWFGLPDAIEVVKRVIARVPRLGRGLYARDRRLDLVFWMVTEGSRDATFAAYVGSDAFRRYAESLAMPPYADHLAPHQRLVWTFSRKAQEVFALDSREDVASFNRWYAREHLGDNWELKPIDRAKPTADAGGYGTTST